jgi:hypothetical protein
LIRLFVGADPREAVGLSVFCSSVWCHASQPVSITPIGANVCGTDGTNAFSLARFHVPRLCGYEGWAIWMDGSDMLMLDDIAKLWALRDEKYAVQVVKHEYTPRHRRKYVGTDMEAENASYARKNWSSVVLFNCGLWAAIHSHLSDGPLMHRFEWLHDDMIGALPPEWNWLADEDGQCEAAKARVVHYTNGIPAFPHYHDAPFASLWRAERKAMLEHA